LIALALAVKVHHLGYEATRLTRNDRFSPKGLENGQYLIGIIRFVGQHFTGFTDGVQQFHGPLSIMLLACAQHGVHGPTPGVS
jgi:hypothetical protein